MTNAPHSASDFPAGSIPWSSAEVSRDHAGAFGAENASSGQSVAADGRTTVLVIDDDALVLLNTVDMLDDLGFDAIAAASGPEALDIFARRNADLIITDLSMPVMSGLDVATSIFALKPDIPIIVATGYGELPANSDSRLLRLGKPYSQKSLAAAVERARSRRG